MPITINGDGSVGPLSAAEMGYLDGVTSAVQTQINNKAPIDNAILTGNIGINNTNPTNSLVVGSTNGVTSSRIVSIINSGNSIEWGHSNPSGYRCTLGALSGGGQPFIAFGAEHGTNSNTFRTRGLQGAVIQSLDGTFNFMTVTNSNADNQTATNRMTISNTGSVTVVGSLSKGSGSFKIDHPLKPETHYLVHSFIEGPQADLIYSGMVFLVNGSAEINIDEEYNMTEGTFVALTRNHRRMTTNESGFTPIKSELNENILTITAQDEKCNDEVYWQVIGERQDDHMIDTDWTDETGRVIVEPEKNVLDDGA